MESLSIVVACPVCGRPAQIQVGHIGRRLTCGHCHGLFVAIESPHGAWATSERNRPDLLERAERLLALKMSPGRPNGSLGTPYLSGESGLDPTPVSLTTQRPPTRLPARRGPRPLARSISAMLFGREFLATCSVVCLLNTRRPCRMTRAAACEVVGKFCSAIEAPASTSHAWQRPRRPIRGGDDASRREPRC